MTAEMGEKMTLGEAFKQANHYRHILMDVAMFTTVIGGLVATGGAFGLLDPIGLFLNMHIPSLSNIAALVPGVEGVFNAASNGSWATDMFWADAHELAHAPAVPGVDVDSGSLSLNGTVTNSLGWE